MTQLQTIFYNSIIWTQIISCLTAIINFNKFKNSYWKWFVYYIVLIAILDFFGKYGLNSYPNLVKYYYNFFVIPLEFLFFFWLLSKKSLKQEAFYWTANIIYLLSMTLPIFGFDKIRVIGSISYTIGNLLLAIMIFLEFLKQIRSDDILMFRKNTMFYVNIGILLFYIGTLPLFAFDKYLFENNKTLWSYYYTFFLFSVNLMYLLFAASFIWGKPKS